MLSNQIVQEPVTRDLVAYGCFIISMYAVGQFLADCCDQGKEPYISKDGGIDESFIQIYNDEYSKNFSGHQDVSMEKSFIS